MLLTCAIHASQPPWASSPFHSDTLTRNLENVQRSSVLLPAPSPALPAALADAPRKRGHLATAIATQLVDIVSDDGASKSSLRRLSWGRAGSSRATCQSLISDLSGVESSPVRNKCTSPGRAESAATQPSTLDGRAAPRSAPPAVCARLLGGVAAASGRHREVHFSRNGQNQGFVTPRAVPQ